MLKNPTRALVSLETRHWVAVQINRLNIYKHLSHSLPVEETFTS